MTRKTHRDAFSAVTPGPPAPRQSVIDLYQLGVARMQVDHCEISGVAVQLHDDGRWVLSLRGDQNRRPEAGQPGEYQPRLHVKRNEFVIRLRCLGAHDHPAAGAQVGAGKPVLVDLGPCIFWVENGQPRYVREQGWEPLVAEHFADIDRMEIEFFYR